MYVCVKAGGHSQSDVSCKSLIDRYIISELQRSYYPLNLNQNT